MVAIYELPLAKGGVALIDETDKPLVEKWSWHIGDRGYVQATISEDGQKQVVRLHQLLMNFPARMVDHRDLNKLNNTRLNLRLATNSQNQANRKATAHSSQFKGVHVPKAGRVQARIVHQGRHYYLGTFATEQDAARAYDAKAIELFGEFARLNFPVEV